MKNALRYFSDANSSYKVNYEYKSIIKLGNKGIKYIDFSEVETIEKLSKLKKDIWTQRLNEYYRTHRFEWVFKGRQFETVDTPFSTTQLQENNDPILMEAFPYHKFLAFHNGEVWAVYWSGNYYPRMQLGRVTNTGERRQKWTDVNNVKNFQ